MLKSILPAACLALFCSGQVFAAEECTAPIAPELPANGAVISHEQLTAAADQIALYLKDNMTYKSCLDVTITQPQTVSRKQWRAALEAYNQTAPAEQAIWKAYDKLTADWVKANQAKKNDK